MRTLAQAITDGAAQYPAHTHTYQDSAGRETTYTFVELERRTARIAAGLQERGLRKGDRIGLVLIEPEEFILTFLAAIRVGIVPVPLYPPMSMSELDAYVDKLVRITTNADAKLMVVSDRAKNIVWQVVDRVPSLRSLVNSEELLASDGTAQFPEIHPDDLAFLQYTSGSTSDPKGVMVTHRCLSANAIAVTNDGLRCDAERDVTVSWLPLYHDMGLIGFVIAPLFIPMSAVYIPTVRFLKRPSSWMDAVHRHRGSVCFCPPFALALMARRAKEEELQTWDLSCLRVVGVGAEPIQPAGVRQFTELFSSRCNMPRNAVVSAYGMAEATLAMALKPLEQELRTRHVDANTFQAEGLAVDTEPGPHALEHVSCGVTFPDHELAIFGPDGQRLPESQEGHIHFRGPSVAGGYFQNPEATLEAFRSDGWLATGDLGYMHEGELYVTGRLKDLIIVNGRNLHPQSIEWPIYDLEGVRRGNVVAFSRPGAETEELVLVAETTANPPESLAQDIRDVVKREFGVPVADVVLLGAGELPKTSSGKLQRRRARQLYLTGQLGKLGSRTMGATGSKILIAKHVARSMLARVKNIATR